MANEKIVNRENLKAFRQANDQRYIDGQVVVGKSLSTKAVDNISEESGTTQETPFINQGTGTNNNTDETPTSPVGKQLEKQGNTVCVNQLVQSTLERDDTGIASYSNYVVTLNGTLESTNYIYLELGKQMLPNRKYLLWCKGANADVFLRWYSNGVSDNGVDNTGNGSIVSSTTGGNVNLFIIVGAGTYSNYKLYPLLIDLTKWFNGDIPSDLLSHPENFFRYYQGSLAYNTGTLVNSDGQYLECGQGRNQWDETTANVYWDEENNGTRKTNASSIGSNDYIKVIPNTTYYFYSGKTARYYVLFYDKDHNLISHTYRQDLKEFGFTTPSNCIYITWYSFSSYGTTYNHDITISLYYTTGENYNQYYPYVAPKTYDTGVEVLRKAGSVKDTKAPDGTITRNVGTYTFTGEETWETLGEQGAKSCNVISSLSKGASGSSVANVLCPILIAETFNNIYYGNNTNGIAISSAGLIVVNTNQVSNLTGKTIYYELATPTTEQGTPFSENIEINDYGTMAWLDSNNALVEIPQGCKIFYPADYVLLMDDLNNYVDGDVSKLALKTDLASDKSELQGVDTQLKNAIGGTLRQCLCVKESLDFDNTDFVDLGDLNWSYAGGRFYTSDLRNIVKEANNKGLCTLYARTSENVSNMPNLTFKFDSSKDLNINNTSYTDATAFKNAMKGVLLAYEKAS